MSLFPTDMASQFLYKLLFLLFSFMLRLIEILTISDFRSISPAYLLKPLTLLRLQLDMNFTKLRYILKNVSVNFLPIAPSEIINNKSTTTLYFSCSEGLPGRVFVCLHPHSFSLFFPCLTYVFSTLPCYQH